MLIYAVYKWDTDQQPPFPLVLLVPMVLMRCSLQMVYQWTEEISICTNGANRKASLTNGDFYQWYHWWGFLDDWYLFVCIGHVWRQIYAVYFNTAVKTEQKDHDELIKILSSLETSLEKKRFISFHLGVAKQLELSKPSHSGTFFQSSSFQSNNGKTPICLHMRRGRLNWVRLCMCILY